MAVTETQVDIKVTPILRKTTPSVVTNDTVIEQNVYELFSLCDKGRKGFITRSEMQRLHGELPMTPEQLEQVFDVLDEDGDGRLTLQEFADGFGMFVGIKAKPEELDSLEEVLEAGGQQSLSTGYESDDEHFSDLLDSLGAENLFSEEDVIKRMWDYIRREDDQMLMKNFQEFLARITKELLDSKCENMSLESTLKSRKHDFDQQMQDLYEEMERQMQLETEQRLAEEKMKEQKLREELEVELNVKEEQMVELLDKQTQLEKRLQEIQDVENETKKSNIQLQKERDMLEYRLQASESMLTELRQIVESLRHDDLREKRRQVEASWNEGMTWERDSLVKQLQILRNINKKLLDERDEIDILQQQFASDRIDPLVFEEEEEENGKSIAKTRYMNSSTESERAKSRGSVMADYLDHQCSTPIARDHRSAAGDLQSPLPDLTAHSLENIAEITRDSGYSRSPRRHQPHQLQDPYTSPENNEDDLEHDFEESQECVENGIKLTALPSSEKPYSETTLPLKTNKTEVSVGTSQQRLISASMTRESNRGELSDPDRLFKIVFIGDSGVGKTSFIHRFCHNAFKSTFSATIGMDFRVTSFKIDGHLVALQLWDTAGQERFRSITRQYYRKADAVIVMYDVTSETSFKNVRNWMNSVKEGAEDDVVLVLLGNKTDLCKSEYHRVVRKKDGTELAKEYNALFYEVSARTGIGINDAIGGMCSLLQLHEDRRIERTLQLHDQAKKKSCC